MAVMTKAGGEYLKRQYLAEVHTTSCFTYWTPPKPTVTRAGSIDPFGDLARSPHLFCSRKTFRVPFWGWIF